MGEPDNYYDKICHDRFDKLEEKHEESMSKHDKAMRKINDLAIKIDNGLTHRTQRIERLMWILIAGIVVEGIITRIFG